MKHPLLAAGLLAVTVPFMTACAEQADQASDIVPDDTATDQSFGFNLALALSDRAQSTLSELGEEIVVSASYYGSPTPEGEKYANEVGQIDLGGEDVQVPVGASSVVEITGSGIDAGKLQWVAGDVMVNVNAYSARLSGDDNLLACDFIDGPLSAVTATPVTLHCALIEEGVETEQKP